MSTNRRQAARPFEWHRSPRPLLMRCRIVSRLWRRRYGDDCTRSATWRASFVSLARRSYLQPLCCCTLPPPQSKHNSQRIDSILNRMDSMDKSLSHIKGDVKEVRKEVVSCVVGGAVVAIGGTTATLTLLSSLGTVWPNQQDCRHHEALRRHQGGCCGCGHSQTLHHVASITVILLTHAAAVQARVDRLANRMSELEKEHRVSDDADDDEIDPTACAHSVALCVQR